MPRETFNILFESTRNKPQYGTKIMVIRNAMKTFGGGGEGVFRGLTYRPPSL